MKRLLWINVVLGLWLLVAPFTLGYSASSTTAAANDVVLGILVLAGSWWIAAGMEGAVGVAVFEALCGLWLLIAPFVLMITHLPAAMSNDMIVGVIVLVISVVAAWTLAKPAVRAE